MTELPQPLTGILTARPPPAYVLILIAKTGAVLGTVPISVRDDDEGCERARLMVDNHAVELWDGLRFIEHIPARLSTTITGS